MQVYVPASKFIPGTNLYTTIRQWRVVGKRVYVEFTDGFVMRSEETPATLRNKATMGEVTCVNELHKY